MNAESAPENNDTNESNGKGGSGNAFMLQQLYTKDVSFESPNAPAIFKEANIEPETELNIRNSHSAVGDDQYEVVLHIRVHAKKGEDTIFLAELDQAGIFLLKGYSQDQINMLLGTQCPATLFPYAREALSSLVGKGGFPPLILQPINFDMLYARARKQQQGQQEQQLQ
jgi:preprotein translocase subunit SecB